MASSPEFHGSPKPIETGKRLPTIIIEDCYPEEANQTLLQEENHLLNVTNEFSRNQRDNDVITGNNNSLLTHREGSADVIFVRRGAVSVENIHRDIKDGKASGLCEKIRHIQRKIDSDKVYKDKFWFSVSLILSFFVLGWLLGQNGPSLLDLQVITHVSLEKASLYVTFLSAGYMVGSVIGGFLYDRCNRCLLMFFFLCGLALSVIILPWCTAFEAMLTVQFVVGIFQGSIDTVTCAEMVAIWDKKSGQSFMQALHFGFSMGGIISPLVTAPFLSDSPPKFDLNITESITSNTSSFRHPTFLTNLSDSTFYSNSTLTSDQNIVYRAEEDSKLYIAYAISGVVTFLVAAPFILIYCTNGGEFEHNKSRTDKTSSRPLQLVLKIAIIFTMSIMSMLYTGLEETFVEFISVFVVKQVDWSKTSGSIATSLYFGSIGMGHFINMFIVRVCDPLKLMGINCFVLVIVLIVLLLSSSNFFHAGVWISCPLVGISLSVIYPIIFTWTENVFMPVTGRISCIFILTGALGDLINPIILGLLMDEFTPMWFCYLLLIESILQLLFYIIGMILSNIVRNKDDRPEESTEL